MADPIDAELGSIGLSDYICVANITFVVAISEKEAECLTTQDKEAVAEEICMKLNRMSVGSSTFKIKYVVGNIRLGCLVVVLSGLLAGAGFLLVNYKKVKENIKEMAKDVSKTKIKIEKIKKDKEVSLHLRETNLATEKMVEDAMSQLKSRRQDR